MAIIRRGNKLYIAVRPDGKYGTYKFHRLPDDTPQEVAEQINKEALIKIKERRGKRLPSIRGDTINDLWDGYLLHKETYYKPKTKIDIEIAGNNLKRFIGNVPLTSLTTAHIELYIRQRKKEKGRAKNSKISNRTINKELAWLSGFFKYCTENKIEVPDIKIKPLPYKRPIPIILSISECMSLLDNLEPLYKGFVACLYLTGMRLNEARMLKKADIDYNNNVIYVRDTKSGNPKTIGIPEWLKELLLGIDSNGSEYIFVSRVTGGHIVNIRNALNRACKKAGITKHVHPHLLRHSIGAHLTDLDMSMRKIQELLGHSRLSTTEWYTQVAIENKQKVAQTINSLVKRL